MTIKRKKKKKKKRECKNVVNYLKSVFFIEEIDLHTRVLGTDKFWISRNIGVSYGSLYLHNKLRRWQVHSSNDSRNV